MDRAVEPRRTREARRGLGRAGDGCEDEQCEEDEADSSTLHGAATFVAPRPLGERPALVREIRLPRALALSAFHDATLCFLRCQWNADGKDAIPGACEKVAETFKPA